MIVEFDEGGALVIMAENMGEQYALEAFLIHHLKADKPASEFYDKTFKLDSRSIKILGVEAGEFMPEAGEFI